MVLSNSEMQRLISLKTALVDPDLAFLASVLVDVVKELDSQEDYRAEQNERQQ